MGLTKQQEIASDPELSKVIALIKAVLEHTKKVNKFIQETKYIPNDTYAWMVDESHLEEALKLLTEE